MVIYVDADANPVQDEIIAIAKERDLSVVLIKSYAHFSYEQLPEHVVVTYVDREKESADMKIVAHAKRGDFVITHDYGLASLCLQKNCIVIHPKGFQYTNEQIDRLLSQRHAQQKARRAGLRTKGPRKMTEADRETFKKLLKTLIDKHYA